MGCGASKGSSKEESPSEITFKPVGVECMDNFFKSAKDVLDQLSGITGPLNDEKEKFFDANGFSETPGTSKNLKIFIKHTKLLINCHLY